MNIQLVSFSSESVALLSSETTKGGSGAIKWLWVRQITEKYESLDLAT